MNGMLPPMPQYTTSLPKYSFEAAFIESCSQLSTAGASQPDMAFSTLNSACAPYNTSCSTVCLIACAAALASTLGGVRNDSFSVVYGRMVLPAMPTSGMPAWPITASIGRQVLLRIISYGSGLTGCMPATNGKPWSVSLPRISAA